MDDLVARLKAADEMDSKEQYQEGRKAGEMWVKTEGRPNHLRSLDDRTRNGDHTICGDVTASSLPKDTLGNVSA